jgi:hypothetical protein
MGYIPCKIENEFGCGVPLSFVAPDQLHCMLSAVFRSGIPSCSLTELHGNCLHEECVSCNRVYHRDDGRCVMHGPNQHARCSLSQIRAKRIAHLQQVDPNHPMLSMLQADAKAATPASAAKLDKSDLVGRHYTGRFCVEPACRSPLIDDVIEFSDTLFDDVLAKCQDAVQQVSKPEMGARCAHEWFKWSFFTSRKNCVCLCDTSLQADLLIILGSSIVVDPLRSIVCNNLHKKSDRIGTLKQRRSRNHHSFSLKCVSPVTELRW